MIRYERRQEGPVDLPQSTRQSDEVFYIDADTPVPDMPQPKPPVRRPSDGDDDVLYIGDE